MVNNLIFVVNSFFQIYFWLILLRCLLSFVPSIDWYKQPFEALRDVTDLYLNIFRKIIYKIVLPAVGVLDFSPIVAVIALQILNYLIIFVLLMFR